MESVAQDYNEPVVLIDRKEVLRDKPIIRNELMKCIWALVW